jgi:hypothetical protein
VNQRVEKRVAQFVVAVAVIASGAFVVRAQVQYRSGQAIAPSYEGWLPNADGSFDLLFGYMNRNFEEHLHIPVGPNNAFEPGPVDQGQPTYFMPRRNMNQFRITVPKDFGKKELIWTVTSNGKTEKAYAGLKAEYILDARGIYRQYTGFDVQGEVERNKPPVVKIQGDLKRTVAVGEALSLSATGSDDGIPKASRGRGGPFQGLALGFRVAWHVFRGPGEAVTFDPPQFKVYPDYISGSPWMPGWTLPTLPPDGSVPVRVRFATPGTYVIRVLAFDGGAESYQDVTVTVTPAAAKG